MSDAGKSIVSSERLVPARTLCHAACQWPSRAARANREALPDDSHSALAWRRDLFALVGQPLDAQQRFTLGFGFSERALLWMAEGNVVDRLPLDGKSDSEVGGWVDTTLEAAGLEAATSARMPYELAPVGYEKLATDAEAVATLGDWYDAADAALREVVDRFGFLAVSAPVVRCWPHHFDIAVLLALEEGDPETARSIGTGLSPGDESYAEPYIYCTPWPVPAELPDAVAKLTWHTAGFTSLVCPVSRLSAALEATEVFLSGVEQLLPEQHCRQ